MKLTATDLTQHIAQRYSPLVTRMGGRRIDTQQMLASGVLTGPHHRSARTSLSPLRRFARRVINFLERQ